MNERILAAMSGGVDSAVCAYLLKSNGFNVSGATLVLVDNNISDAQDAHSVCDMLSITHHTIEARNDFEKLVIMPFASSYLAGETPNPCIQCNKTIKFGLLLNWASENGFSKLATGHYARIRYDATSERYLLYTAYDDKKDQSYFLYSLSQEQLRHIMFPLGELTKADIREIASLKKLPCALRSDSQDICFVPNGNYYSFIEKCNGYQHSSGCFTDTMGNILGKHDGAERFTIGQRRGLHVSGGKPLYVVSKDMKTGTVVLGDNDSLFSTRLIARNVNWISFADPKSPLKAEVKIRYSKLRTKALIIPENNNIVTIEFESAVRAAAKGQSVVFYDGALVLGGGIIA